MLLTIYVPTFQRPELSACLNSIIPQLTNQCELIVSDNDADCSARDLCKELQVSYLHNYLNVGADGNCLRGLVAGSGEYLWVFGDDDVMLPGAVDATLRMIKGQDRIIHVGAQHGEVPFGFDGLMVDWVDCLQDKGMVVASTLCTVNVWRRNILDPYLGIQGLDSRNVICCAGVGAATVTVAEKPYVVVGRDHLFSFPNPNDSMNQYLLDLHKSIGRTFVNKTYWWSWNYQNA